jgi:hypothetical protein
MTDVSKRILPSNPDGNPNWEKGKSANPGGRPKTVREVRELANQYTVKAILTIAELMEDRDVPHKVRLAAAALLLDRAHGRPTQMISGDPDGPALVLQIVKLAGASPEQIEAYRRSGGEIEAEN